MPFMSSDSNRSTHTPCYATDINNSTIPVCTTLAKLTVKSLERQRQTNQTFDVVEQVPVFVSWRGQGTISNKGSN